MAKDLLSAVNLNEYFNNSSSAMKIERNCQISCNINHHYERLRRRMDLMIKKNNSNNEMRYINEGKNTM